jgi:hypothetical protein
MTIATYAELVSEMGDWLNRTDLTAKIPTFVRLFEARMNRRLRSPGHGADVQLHHRCRNDQLRAVIERPRAARVFIDDDGTLAKR